MSYLKKYLFLVIAYSLLQLSSLDAAQVHAIIVADTLIGAGNRGMEVNIDAMQREVKQIAAYTNLPLTIAVFEEYNVKVKNILKYFNEINIAPDDIVIFYINNHGSRNKDKTNQWPNLIFPLDQIATKDHVIIDFNDLVEILKGKNPKLLISIAEACNSIVDEDASNEDESDDSSYEETEATPEELEAHQFFLNSTGPTSIVEFARQSPTLVFIRQKQDDEILDFYHELYVKPRGSITISSSSPGEGSVTGIFTQCLLEAIDEVVDYSEWCKIGFLEFKGSPSLEWKDILSLAAQKTKKKFEIWDPKKITMQESQTVQYVLDLE